jgi:hypothetical protein
MAIASIIGDEGDTMTMEADRPYKQRLVGRFILGCLACWLACVGCVAGAQSVARFDFTAPQTLQEWQPAHDVAPLQHTHDGLRIVITGDDPYIIGPARDYPAGQALWLRIRLKSEQGGGGQIFYFERNATEQASVRFPVRAGRWEEVQVPLPPLGPGMHLRLDPPGTGGVCLVSAITLIPRQLLPTPLLPHPAPLKLGSDAIHIHSGALELIHAHHQLGGFMLKVAGQPMAVGNNRLTIGYLQAGKPRYFTFGQQCIATASMDRDAIEVRALMSDPDGGNWEVHQSFAPGKLGSIDVRATVHVDQARDVIFLPLLTLLPGVGTYGETKQQALFPGLEYLDKDEPSSSEADIKGPGALRQIPDSEQITFPLMALRANDRYVALTWQQDRQIAAHFDSPDRTLHAGGHLMGLLFPGSDGNNRAPGSLLPYQGERLSTGQSISLHATLLGGPCNSITAAVQQYVALRGLPPSPNPGLDWQGYIALAAAGWLDSGIAADGRFRHAYPNFAPQPAADAALMMDYLSAQTRDKPLSERLREAAQRAAALAPASDLNASGVAHIRTLAPALVLSQSVGDVQINAKSAERTGRDLTARFAEDGSIPYRKSPEGLDYGRTHFAPDANGLTAQVVASQLEAASFSGDPSLIAEAIRHLHGLDKFRNTAPRGAQTWEVPLHTPDILASAYLTRAYTLGYELTGDATLLQQAVEWAWTGAPFIYLANPTDQTVGLYATIPVYGATQWVAPNWMGLPVQWCGLVYADALYRLEDYDPRGPWDRLADGITASGIQQTWPRHSDPHRQGLLPDSFEPKTQTRNDAAINPGTLLVNAIHYYNRPSLYSCQPCHNAGLLIHAPGDITLLKERADQVAFRITGWARSPYELLVVGLKKRPRVRVNGQDIMRMAPNQFSEQEGRLVLQVQGSPSIQIDLH